MWKIIEGVISGIVYVGFGIFAVLLVGSVLGMPKETGIPILFWTTGVMLTACAVGIIGVKLDPYYRH